MYLGSGYYEVTCFITNDQEMIADSIIDSRIDDQISVTNNIREDNDRFITGFFFQY